MLADPQLRTISTILFDEFHERHLYGDITLARALDPHPLPLTSIDVEELTVESNVPEWNGNLWGIDPKTMYYQSQKLKVRFRSVVEAIERLIGARPGAKLEVNFRAAPMEETIAKLLSLQTTVQASYSATSRLLSLSLTDYLT